jgi:serine phosphatase RsbU (regulator of sigma subunit)
VTTAPAGTGVGSAAPRLARLLPRREAAEQVTAFAPVLAGHVLSVVDAQGAVLAEAGGLHDGAVDEADVWRGDLVHDGARLGALRIRPAPVGTAATAAAAALLAGLQRSVLAAGGRRDLVAETLERYREVNLLYRLGDVLGGELDPASLPERVLDEALRLIDSDGAALVVDGDGAGPGSWVASGCLAEPGSRDVVADTRAGLADDARPAILGGPGAFPGAGPAIGASLWSPLRVRERTLGGVMLVRRSGAAVFTAGDEKLLSALATQAAAYLDNARLHQQSLAQARLAQELQLAHDVQARLMPRVMPERPGWRVAASWTPARSVAGDFFDATLSGDAIAVAVGDVADKGMAAALFMALTRSVLRASAAPGRSAGEVIGRANALLCADATDGMFVTLAYALLEPGGTVRYANAGHNPPLLVRSGGAVEELGRTGILVGWDEGAVFGEARAQLERGDALVLYTDGVTEALDEGGREYGEERFRRMVVRHRGDGAEALLRALLADLEAFVGTAEAYDDATLMVVTRDADASGEAIAAAAGASPPAGRLERERDDGRPAAPEEEGDGG